MPALYRHPGTPASPNLTVPAHKITSAVNSQTLNGFFLDLITLSPKPPKSAASYSISGPSKTLQQNRKDRQSGMNQSGQRPLSNGFMLAGRLLEADCMADCMVAR